MIIENEKDFIGIQSGSQLFEKEVEERLTYASKTLGNIYSKMGYRGSVSLDFLVDKNNTVYVG